MEEIEKKYNKERYEEVNDNKNKWMKDSLNSAGTWLEKKKRILTSGQTILHSDIREQLILSLTQSDKTLDGIFYNPEEASLLSW